MRYMDSVTILSVVSIITSYSLSGTVSMTGEFQASSNPNILTPEIIGVYSQSPTITYNEVTGKEFVERFIVPASPTTLASLVNSGWRADRVFTRMVEEVNGIRNRNRAIEFPGDNRFERVTYLLRFLQKNGALNFNVNNSGTDDEKLELQLLNPNRNPAVEKSISEFRQLLNLDQKKYL